MSNNNYVSLDGINMNEKLKSHKFFGYGLFLDTSRLALNKNSEQILGAAFLPYHKLVFDTHATIIKTNSEKDVVWGILYKINNDTLESLDTVEGYPIYYDRVLTTIYTSTGKVNDVYVYVMKGKLRFRPPSLGYYNLIKNKSIQHKFPNEYIDYINTIYKSSVENFNI